MAEQSYAVFEKEMKYPTISDMEKFLFDARTRGAGDKTRLNFQYVYDKYSVKIPEGSTTTVYAEKPVSKRRGIPTVVWLGILILAIVLGIFV